MVRVAVGNPRVPDPLGVQHQVVLVMRDDDPTGGQGKGDVLGRPALEATSRVVVISIPRREARGNGRRDVLIKMKLEDQRIVPRSFSWSGDGEVLLYSGIGPGHLLLDLLRIVPVVGQGGVDIRQRELGEVRHDLIGALPSKFVPDIDILNADPRAGDAGLAATDSGLLLDVLRQYGFHQVPPFYFRLF